MAAEGPVAVTVSWVIDDGRTVQAGSADDRSDHHRLLHCRPLLREGGIVFYIIDYVIAALLALDLAARAYAYSDIKDWLKKPIVWVDLFILATLLFPAWLFNLGFLRVIRLWTLVNSDFSGARSGGVTTTPGWRTRPRRWWRW